MMNDSITSPHSSEEGGAENKKLWEKWRKRIQNSDKKMMKPYRNDMRTIFKQWKSQFQLEREKKHNYLSGHIYFVVAWRVGAKIKLPDADVILSGAPKVFEKIASAGLRQGKRKSKLWEAYCGEGGIKRKFLKYGNGAIEKDIRLDESGYPTIFRPSSMLHEYFDPDATVMCAEESDEDCGWRARMYRFSPKKFEEKFPEWRGKVRGGKMPLSEEEDDQKKYEVGGALGSWEREGGKDEPIYLLKCQDKYAEEEVWFVGADAVVMKEMSGKNYPHRSPKGKAELPVYLFGCLHEDERLLDYGLCHLLSDLFTVERQIMNKGIHALFRNVNPLSFIAMKTDTKESLRRKIASAMYDIARGGEGIVDVPLTPDGKPSVMPLKNIVGTELTGEFERIVNSLEKRLLQLGININDLTTVGDPTVVETQRMEASANAFTLQMEEGKENEFQRAYEAILTDIRDHVSGDDDTPIRIDFELSEKDKEELRVMGGGEPVAIKNPTLGGLKMILQMYPFEVVVQSRTGAFSDRLADMERAQKSVEILAQTFPGSKAHLREVQRLLSLNGGTYEDEDFATPQAQAQ